MCRVERKTLLTHCLQCLLDDLTCRITWHENFLPAGPSDRKQLPRYGGGWFDHTNYFRLFIVNLYGWHMCKKSIPEENCSRKLPPMHVFKIVRFDWSAVFERFWYKKLHRTELQQVSGTSFLSVCHSYKAFALLSVIVFQPHGSYWCIPIRDSNRFDSIHLMNRFGFPKNWTVWLTTAWSLYATFDCECTVDAIAAGTKTGKMSAKTSICPSPPAHFITQQ